jgi:hypothetical protein
MLPQGVTLCEQIVRAERPLAAARLALGGKPRGIAMFDLTTMLPALAACFAAFFGIGWFLRNRGSTKQKYLLVGRHAGLQAAALAARVHHPSLSETRRSSGLG